MSEFKSAIFEDAFNLLCGEKIGCGMSRNVFTSQLLPNHVVKVETNEYCHQNVIEWETWAQVRYTKFSDWFAPCEWISPDSKILIMRRTRPASDSMYPDEMPIFLSDFKRANYGVYENRLVCHDYGTNLLMTYGMTKRTTKVDWNLGFGTLE